MTDHQRQTIAFESEKEWLSLRERDVTSTQSPALFGASPYLTEYELWHIKAGTLEPSFESNDRVVWGNRLEAAIAYGIAEDLGLLVEPFKVYIRLPDLRLGSSFDFKITGLAPGYTGGENEYRDLFRRHGPGIMECKNVDGLAFMRGWEHGDDGIEAPLHIELQIQHQLLAAGLPWSVCAPLVAGNTPRPFWRIADEQAIAVLEERVHAFWQSREAGIPPDPDYTRDGEAITALNLFDKGESLDLTGNTRLAELCAEYHAGRDQEKAGESRKKTAQAEIMDLIGPAAHVAADGYKITCKTRKGSPGKLITDDLVGTTIGGKAPTRFPTITKQK